MPQNLILLKDRCPHLLEEWDYEKNSDIDINKIGVGDKRKVWWKCKEKECHTWEATIKSRARLLKGTKCPFCTSNKICSCGCNSLASKNPELAKEWCYERNGELLPTQISVNYTKEVWWQCPKKECHKYKAIPHQRNSMNYNCKICAGYVICECLCNTIVKIKPELLKEWDYERNEKLPSEYTFGTYQKVWWVCSKKSCHKWDASIYHRCGNNRNCPMCSNKKICPCKCNSLALMFPEIAEEFHKTKNENTPYDYIYCSRISVWWQCPDNENHVYLKPIANRTGNFKIKCDKCKDNGSKGEYYIGKKLDELNIDYEREKQFDDCRLELPLLFDFYIKSLNILIEFDGIQHFENTKFYNRKNLIRDLIKTNFASKYFYFLRISHLELKDINSLIQKFINDVQNKNIKIGFYFNYNTIDLKTNIIDNYETQSLIEDDNLDIIYFTMLNLIEYN